MGPFRPASSRASELGLALESSLKTTYPVDAGFLLHQNGRDGELVEIKLEAVSR